MARAPGTGQVTSRLAGRSGASMGRQQEEDLDGKC